MSGTEQSFRGPRGRQVRGSIEHSAPLPRGSSGSPVVDTERPPGRLEHQPPRRRLLPGDPGRRRTAGRASTRWPPVSRRSPRASVSVWRQRTSPASSASRSACPSATACWCGRRRREPGRPGRHPPGRPHRRPPAASRRLGRRPVRAPSTRRRAPRAHRRARHRRDRGAGVVRRRRRHREAQPYRSAVGGPNGLASRAYSQSAVDQCRTTRRVLPSVASLKVMRAGARWPSPPWAPGRAVVLSSSTASSSRRRMSCTGPTGGTATFADGPRGRVLDVVGADRPVRPRASVRAAADRPRLRPRWATPTRLRVGQLVDRHREPARLRRVGQRRRGERARTVADRRP